MSNKYLGGAQADGPWFLNLSVHWNSGRAFRFGSPGLSHGFLGLGGAQALRLSKPLKGPVRCPQPGATGVYNLHPATAVSISGTDCKLHRKLNLTNALLRVPPRHTYDTLSQATTRSTSGREKAAGDRNSCWASWRPFL